MLFHRSPANGNHPPHSPHVDVHQTEALYREQVGRAVERTLLRRNGRRYERQHGTHARAGGSTFSSVLHAWTPCQVSSLHMSSIASSTAVGLTPHPPRSLRDGTGVKDAHSSSLEVPVQSTVFATDCSNSPLPSTAPQAASRQANASSVAAAAASSFLPSMSTQSDARMRHVRRRQRLRHFLSQRSSLRDSGDSTTFVTSHSVSISQEQGPRSAPMAGPHPWQTLMHLGSSNFNDAPLDTFMSSLSLSCEGHKATARDPSAAAVRVLQPCVVHVANAEATEFRVYVPSSLYASPIRPLVARMSSGGGEGGLAGDGAVFCLTPLVDEDDSALLAGSVATGNRQTSGQASSGNAVVDRLAASASVPVANQHGAMLASSGRSQKTEACRVPPSSGLLPGSAAGRTGTCFGREANASPSSDELTDTRTSPSLDGTLAMLRTLTTDSTAAQRRQNVEAWRRYSTSVALYLCLAQAGVCDTDSLPFVSVQLLPLRELLGGCDVRVELMGSPAKERATQWLQQADAGDAVPVAITLPIARKGALRRLPEGSEAPSLAVQPFTDAEVFQLFYLQLVFRAFFDVRFPDMTWPSKDGRSQGGWLRADRVGAVYCEQSGLAFEHPTQPQHWLLFPARSRILTILDMEHAVIPLYASPHDLARSASARLFGTTPDVPCMTSFGASVVEWASQLEVNSPRAAYKALAALFTRFAGRYGCSRTTVWHASGVPPKVFRCSESRSFEAMRTHCTRLSRFFVSPENRMVDVDSPTRRQLLAERDTPFLASASRPLSRQPSALRDFPKPALPTEWATPWTESGQQGDSSIEAAHAGDSQTAPQLGGSFSVLEPPPPPAGGVEDDGVLGMAPLSLAQTPSVRSTRTQQLHSSVTSIRPPELTSLVVGEPVDSDAVLDDEALALTVGATSPFTKQESLVTRWRYYAHEGNISIFDGVTTGIELHGFLGRGGSGLVYRGRYGKRGLPVAVKVFIIPDGMAHESYVRESLTDVAFFVLMNQLDDFGVCNTCRAHDFIVSAIPPHGLPEEDANMARRNRDPQTTQLCYLITDLMDGTLGRFLTEDEDDYDPCYDTIVNSPLNAAELFHFLFVQLAAKAMFDWRILDLMLHGQLRGDNVGYRHVALPAEKRSELASDPEALASLLLARNYYDGILVCFQGSAEEEMRYLRFPADPATLGGGNPLRFIYFIDLGQGLQPNVAELTSHAFIGETVVDSCVEDDGFGRYWPIDELYCRYVDVSGSFADKVVEWGSAVRLDSQEAAVRAMNELFELYYPVFGVPAPTEEALMSHMVFNWSPGVVAELKRAYVYRPDPL